MPLDRHIEEFTGRRVTASFVTVRTSQSFHAVLTDNEGMVTGLGKLRESDFWINGGFFCFRRAIWDCIQEGEELVEEPFQRLIAQRQLAAYRYGGFFQSMDTFKDKITLDRMEARGDCPWMVWKGAKRLRKGSPPVDRPAAVNRSSATDAGEFFAKADGE